MNEWNPAGTMATRTAWIMAPPPAVRPRPARRKTRGKRPEFSTLSLSHHNYNLASISKIIIITTTWQRGVTRTCDP